MLGLFFRGIEYIMAIVPCEIIGYTDRIDHNMAIYTGHCPMR